MCSASDCQGQKSPAKKELQPSMAARYSTASILLAILAVWGKFSFPPAAATPGLTLPMHSCLVPLCLTLFYLASLPALRCVTENYLAKKFDMKELLTESMVIYNVAQVILNGWMVYAMIDAVLNRGHPFIGDNAIIHTGASYAVWVHYCDKYLEFFDTYFMILRGKMDQVSFLHIYHHTTIAWAWWIALRFCPGGDSYFGALLNSIIHVLMYSYYALALLKVKCPWKRYLTQAQLLQFASVVFYSICTCRIHYIKNVDWTFFLCVGVQVFEMVSLFVLFSIFYKKSYSKKSNRHKTNNAQISTRNTSTASLASTASSSNPSTSMKNVTDDSEDQCHKAMSTFTEATKEAVGTAAKDATKLMASAQKAIHTSAVKKEAEKGTSRPSWSIVN